MLGLSRMINAAGHFGHVNLLRFERNSQQLAGVSVAKAALSLFCEYIYRYIELFHMKN